MTWVSFQIKQAFFISPTFPPPTLPAATSSGAGTATGSGGFLESKVSPSILLIIIILAIIFFISGLLHLLIRSLIRPPVRDPDGSEESATALQGQLQQLFHLHDAGVDQSFIDETLPVFLYKDVVVPAKTTPFDCAVCLCEFEPEDKLRLLPKCSHAFHVECIDTWLLSHSTCPLCRSSLLDFSESNDGETTCSPVVLVLESGSGRESNNEIGLLGRSNSVLTACSLVGYQGDTELGSFRFESENNNNHNRPEMERYAFVFESGEQSFRRIHSSRREDSRPESNISLGVVSKSGGFGPDRVVRVKLGKFRNVEGGGSGDGDGNADVRRCYSMGSFQYVMDSNSALQVPVRIAKKKKNKKAALPPLTPGHRQAMSVCGCESGREFDRFEEETKGYGKNSSIVPESFSISSKIWAREKKRQGKEKQGSLDAGEVSSSVSLRFHPTNSAELGSSSGGNGELDDSKTPSFARRTLLWLAGRPQNKIFDSNSGPNVV